MGRGFMIGDYVELETNDLKERVKAANKLLNEVPKWFETEENLQGKNIADFKIEFVIKDVTNERKGSVGLKLTCENK